MNAQVNNDDAGERDPEKHRDNRFSVKPRAGAEPRGSRYEQQGQQTFCGAVECHFSGATFSFARVPR
jgi:hypothetical protein